jgi:hypothetical protein
MTEARLALAELLEKAGDGDFLRSVAEAVLQMRMEADVEGLVGAARYEQWRAHDLAQWATATAFSTGSVEAGPSPSAIDGTAPGTEASDRL